LGTYPDSSLAMDAAGNFYGTTYQGGNSNLGTVFKLKAGKNDKYTYSVIYSFKGGSTDGQYPWYGMGVALDAKGNLFGTTRYGGSTSNGGIVLQTEAHKWGILRRVSCMLSGAQAMGFSRLQESFSSKGRSWERLMSAVFTAPVQCSRSHHSPAPSCRRGPGGRLD
jgi:uncharacterized repeat protein (TIGR03803 family)